MKNISFLLLHFIVAPDFPYYVTHLNCGDFVSFLYNDVSKQ